MGKSKRVIVPLAGGQRPIGFRRSEAAVDALCREVGSRGGQIDRERVFTLFCKVTDPAHVRLFQALLASSARIETKALAVELNPSLGKRCADDLMARVRVLLQHTEEAPNATEARTLLYYAQVWYEKAEALTPELDMEIRQGLDVTAWVTHQR